MTRSSPRLLRMLLPTIALSLAAAPAATAQPLPSRSVTNGHGVMVLTDEQVAEWRNILAALDAKEWERARALLALQPDSPLKGFVEAEIYTAAASPRTDLSQIEAWLARYSALPQAAQILSMGQKRGLTASYALPSRNQLIRASAPSKRLRPASVADGTMPDNIAAAIQERIKADDPDAARLLLDGIDAQLSAEARAEWRQRVAWSYYIENRDAAALALALSARAGRGAWVAESDWTAGLAAWRLGDCQAALDGFGRAAVGAGGAELRAAAHYWAARSAIRCRAPEIAARNLRQAAGHDETLYGMLAREQLGQGLPDTHRVDAFSARDWSSLRTRSGAELAVALSQLGRDVWASQVLQHEVQTGDPAAYPALARLARHLNLPRTQVWMGLNVPRGAKADPALRYPISSWRPAEGWRIDPALAFAHTLQESDFTADAVSPANAVGLMQVRSIAARDVAGQVQLGASYADLKDPATNLAFGQRNLEKLGQARATGGHLPKVIAAYNAGLTPVTRWNAEVKDGGDPLLYMESIPFWETRSYVAIVLRNYWMYLRQGGGAAPSRVDLVQNKWPAFPSSDGSGR